MVSGMTLFIVAENGLDQCALLWNPKDYRALRYALAGLHGRESEAAAWRYVLSECLDNLARVKAGTQDEGWTPLSDAPPTCDSD